jgi:hypothetical protein
MLFKVLYYINLDGKSLRYDFIPFLHVLDEKILQIKNVIKKMSINHEITEIIGKDIKEIKIENNEEILMTNLIIEKLGIFHINYEKYDKYRVIVFNNLEKRYKPFIICNAKNYEKYNSL